jgi:hypothetical protein
MITRLGVWQAWCLLVKQPSCKSCTHSSRLPEERPPSVPIKYSMSNLQKHYLSNFLVHLDIQLLFSDGQYWFFWRIVIFFGSQSSCKSNNSWISDSPCMTSSTNPTVSVPNFILLQNYPKYLIDTLDIGEIIWNLLSYLRLMKCWSDHLAGVKSFQT